MPNSGGASVNGASIYAVVGCSQYNRSVETDIHGELHGSRDERQTTFLCRPVSATKVGSWYTACLGEVLAAYAETSTQ